LQKNHPLTHKKRYPSVQILKNSVVTFHYQLTNADHGLIEDSRKSSSPIVYLHGHETIFPKLEQELDSKQVGDKLSVTLEPEDAYGHRTADSIQRVSINHVLRASETKKKVRYKIGMPIKLNTKDGPKSVVVVKVGLKMLDVDTNHPLAGVTLTFEVEIISVREATEEEISHGHVHGEGGHQH